MHTIVLIHGVDNAQTIETWQDRAIRLFAGIPNVRVVVYKYGKVIPAGAGFGKGDCWGFRWANPWIPSWYGRINLDQIVNDFASYLEALELTSSLVSVAAHSFGTVVAGEALKLLKSRASSLKIHKMLWAGSAYDPNFDWATYKTLVGEVRHEYCPKDDQVISLVPLGRVLKGSIMPSIGTSGIDGFSKPLASPDWQEQAYTFRSHVKDHHSEFVTDEHIIDFWFPFLLDHDFFSCCAGAHHDLVTVASQPKSIEEFGKYYGFYCTKSFGTESKRRGYYLSLTDESYAFSSIFRLGEKQFRENRNSCIQSIYKPQFSSIHLICQNTLCYSGT